jgi:hypothetical protein
MLLCAPRRADSRSVDSHRFGEVSAVLEWSDDRAQRILTAILEADIPVPAIDLDGDVSPVLVDAIQAAMLRRELATYRRRTN